jgi:hypothetical protein
VPDARRRGVEGLLGLRKLTGNGPGFVCVAAFNMAQTETTSRGRGQDFTGPRLHGAKTFRQRKLNCRHHRSRIAPRNRAAACLSSAQAPIVFLIVALWVYFSGGRYGIGGECVRRVHQRSRGPASVWRDFRNRRVAERQREGGHSPVEIDPACYRASACGFGRGNLTLLDHAGPGR